MRVKRIIIGFMFLLITTLSCGAIAFEYFSIEGGIILIGNSDTSSAPSPLVPAFGASLPLFIEGTGFYILPRLLFAGVDFLLSGTRPAPAEIENGEQLVLFSIIDALAGYRFYVSGPIELGFLAGISVIARLPIAYNDTFASESGVYLSYFYGNMRFVYPDTELSLKWNATQTVGVIFSIKALWPAFHLWDGESLPIYDQFYVAGLIGLSVEI
jgi:hypothetical protein